MKQQGRFLFPRTVSTCAAALLILLANSWPACAQQSASRSYKYNPAARELDAFARALAGVTKYSATVTIFDQKDAQTQNVTFDYTFSKPSNVTVHVIAGPNTGITLYWNGGSTIVAHRGSGLVAMFTKTLSLHDPLVTTLQGESIDQLSFGAILSHAQQEVGRLSLAPGGVINGVPANTLTLVPAVSADHAGLTREVVEMSTTTHLPMRVLGYDGSTLVSNIAFSNIKLQGVSD
jgi:outer membrane lipoprotein-sorting protein